MAGERLWLPALLLSALVHGALLASTGAWVGRGVRPAALEERPIPRAEAVGLEGDTFDVEGLVRDGAPRPAATLAAWATAGARRLSGALARLEVRPPRPR
ncbi:MAG: hypothetical protein JRI23_35980, partial [Deltaproteobacteria bacterium]|nr:hypothetical protein [Deltaproteobacteria bacterium]MBW2537750.1 hypothetical protein [Deltaproteobacteria bacterium]